MMHRPQVSTALLLALVACADNDHAHRSNSSDLAHNENACAVEFADRLGIKVEAVRVGPEQTVRKGHAIVGVSTVNGAKRATCEIDGNGDVVGFDMIRG